MGEVISSLNGDGMSTWARASQHMSQMKPLNAIAGFSNQQALLVLIIAFPLGLIGIGLILSILMRSPTTTASKPSTAQQTNVQDQSPAASAAPELSQQKPTTIQPMESPPPPRPNVASSRTSAGHTCWFQSVRGGPLSGRTCLVRSRINVNNHQVFDVIEPFGLKRSIVLWDNDEVEVFLEGTRYVGTWYEDSDGDVRIDLPSGSFAFRPNT